MDHGASVKQQLRIRQIMPPVAKDKKADSISEMENISVYVNPLMPGGNKNVTFLLPPGIEGLNC